MALDKNLIDGIRAIIVDANIPNEDKLRYLNALDEERERYIISSLDREWIYDMGYYPGSGDIDRLVSKMGDAYSELYMSIDFQIIADDLGFEKHHKCTVCGKTVVDGFHALEPNDKDLPFPTEVYYCSTECKDKHFTELEWQQLSTEQPEDYYYSEWR